jgi:serine/threonine-protein kinase
VIATVASHTIFGLRQQVRKAMQLGQYTLLRKIGEGGMGVVWEAKHAFLRRRTAVKLLPAERAGEEAIARFEREVQITSTLTHPNTIAIYDYGRSADGVFYYAMEYLDGIDLQALVDRDGPQPPGLVAHVLVQLCDALSEAHGVGLIHRDVKPANVILCERGGQPLVAKVLDFGLVKRIDGESGDVKLSQANMLIGTPLYMAPEALASPDRMDARSDLYSVGALGYVLLTGQPVFAGARPLEVFAQHMHSRPVPPSERLGEPIPADLEAIVLECLEKDPSLRPKSAAELSARLAATEAKKAFGPADAREAWDRCRELMASEPIPSSPPETRLTLALRSPM